MLTCSLASLVLMLAPLFPSICGYDNSRPLRPVLSGSFSCCCSCWARSSSSSGRVVANLRQHSVSQSVCAVSAT
jgi:hypothetical protein